MAAGRWDLYFNEGKVWSIDDKLEKKTVDL